MGLYVFSRYLDEFYGFGILITDKTPKTLTLS